MYEYFEKYPEGPKGEKMNIPKKISVGMPFSMRQPVEKLSDVRMVNEFAALPITMAVCQNFGDALSIFKK